MSKFILSSTGKKGKTVYYKGIQDHGGFSSTEITEEITKARTFESENRACEVMSSELSGAWKVEPVNQDFERLPQEQQFTILKRFVYNAVEPEKFEEFLKAYNITID